MWRAPVQPAGMTVIHIHAHLNEYRRVEDDQPPLAYTTYLTVMRNLARRGFVTQTKGIGRSHMFTVVTTREEYEKRVLFDALENLFNSDKKAMLDAVVAL